MVRGENGASLRCGQVQLRQLVPVVPVHPLARPHDDVLVDLEVLDEDVQDASRHRPPRPRAGTARRSATASGCGRRLSSRSSASSSWITMSVSRMIRKRCGRMEVRAREEQVEVVADDVLEEGERHARRAATGRPVPARTDRALPGSSRGRTWSVRCAARRPRSSGSGSRCRGRDARDRTPAASAPGGSRRGSSAPDDSGSRRVYSVGSRMWTPSSARAGRSCSRQQRCSDDIISVDRARVAASCCSVFSPSGLTSSMPGAILLQERRHAHHEELVEVGGDDGQELDALEQGMGLVECLIQDPLVELQPAQLPVDVERRVLEVGRIALRPVGTGDRKADAALGAASPCRTNLRR